MAEARKHLVLVVDDEEDIRTYLTAALEDAGFRVTVAGSGPEALAAIKRERPDFVSLDLVMPGGSGIAFLHELRRNRDWVTIPVMVLTGHARDDLGRADLERALDGKLLSGPQAYLEKPVTPQSYVNAVRQALGLAQPDAVVESARADALRREAIEALGNVPAERLEEVLRLLGKQR